MQVGGAERKDGELRRKKGQMQIGGMIQIFVRNCIGIPSFLLSLVLSLKEPGNVPFISEIQAKMQERDLQSA